MPCMPSGISWPVGVSTLSPGAGVICQPRSSKDFSAILHRDDSDRYGHCSRLPVTEPNLPRP